MGCGEREREGVVVDRSKKGDGERGWMRFKGGGKRREKRERESKSKIQSSVVIYDAFSSEQPRLS